MITILHNFDILLFIKIFLNNNINTQMIVLGDTREDRKVDIKEAVVE